LSLFSAIKLPDLLCSHVSAKLKMRYFQLIPYHGKCLPIFCPAVTESLYGYGLLKAKKCQTKGDGSRSPHHVTSKKNFRG
jgi:hypothetical protein